MRLPSEYLYFLSSQKNYINFFTEYLAIIFMQTSKRIDLSLDRFIYLLK